VIYSINRIFGRVKKPLAKQLGIVIRERRKQAGLSQVVFGEKCGFYQTYLSRLENGQANPTLNALEIVAKALGLTIFELFELVKVRASSKRG
jgi:transcriptional regulator with XRE-family HTH domain